MSKRKSEKRIMFENFNPMRHSNGLQISSFVYIYYFFEWRETIQKTIRRKIVYGKCQIGKRR